MSAHSKPKEAGSGESESHDNRRKKLWFPISTQHENEMSRLSLLEDPFLTVTSLHAKGSKLSNPSLDEIVRLNFVTSEIKKLAKKLLNPLNDDTTVDQLGLELVMLQKEKGEIDETLRERRLKIQLVVNARSKSSSACKFYKFKSDWAKVASWQKMTNACNILLSEVQDQSKSTEIEAISETSFQNDGTVLRTPPNNGTNVMVARENDERSALSLTNLQNNESITNNESDLLIENLDGEQVSLESVFSSAEKNKSVRSMKKKLPNKRKKKSNEPPFTERDFQRQIRKSIGVEKRQLLNESLVFLKDGHIQCMACKSLIECVRSLHRHCANKTHKENLKYWNDDKKKQTLMSATPNENEHPDIIGDAKLFRIDALRSIATANIPISALHDMSGFIEKYASPGHTLGCVQDIPRYYSKTLHAILKDEIKKILSLSYQPFGLIFDGTPSFAEAEAIKVRFVTKKFDINELLVKLSCFKKKLNSDNIANHLIQTIKYDLGLDVRYWYTSQQDRASTNLAALRKIKVNVNEANPTRNDCCAHTFSNCGQAMIHSDIPKYGSLFRKTYQKMIQYPGAARDLAASKFGETVKESGGVRFYKIWEQIGQISDYSLAKLLTEVVVECVNRKWSEASSKKLMFIFGGDENRGELAMAIIELAAMVDVGRLFCTACYNSEGDSPLILTFYLILSKLEAIVDGSGFDISSLERVTDECVGLFTDTLSLLENHVSNDEMEVTAIVTALENATDNLKNLEEQRLDITHTTGTGGRRRQRANRMINNDHLQAKDLEILNATAIIDELQTRLNEKRTTHDEAKINLAKWKETFPHRTRNEILTYGKTIGEPAMNYYIKHFKEETGDLFLFRKRALACKIFDPFFLRGKGNQIQRLQIIAMGLIHFEYQDFDNEFLTCLCKEIPLAVEHADRFFDWELIPHSKQYKTRLDRKIKRRRLDNGDNLDWKNDPGERACQIWEWWKLRMLDNDEFQYFRKALRLVVLTQVSSCSVERVFSQLKIMRDACQDNMLEDMVEIRMFCRCN